jgi:AraC family transcriptional activator of tynA and feaB
MHRDPGEARNHRGEIVSPVEAVFEFGKGAWDVLGIDAAAHLHLQSRQQGAQLGPSGDLNGELESDYEAWRALLHSVCGHYSPEGTEPKSFVGCVRPATIYGCAAVDLSCNADRVERTQQDVRRDSMEHYYAVFQLAGRSTLIQNDRITPLAVGDVALVDSTRPVTYHSENRPGRWLSLHLPRQSLVSHLGVEPEGGSGPRAETAAGRLLFRLVQEAVSGDLSLTAAEPYMQLAIYDLVGALFAVPDNPPSISAHSDKLFKRVCAIIRARFADPDLGPSDVAAEAGISLRYLQKLFTLRGSACSHFIYAMRLDHAALLIQRRAATKTKQPLSAIAYACGFRDYTHFARAFRNRFGHPPGAAESSSAPGR